MADLIKRMRDANNDLCDEAANEIEKLRGEIILLSAEIERANEQEISQSYYEKKLAKASDEATESRKETE